MSIQNKLVTHDYSIIIILDIIFVIKEKEHERYIREGNNLVFSFDVPLKEVLLNVRIL